MNKFIKFKCSEATLEEKVIKERHKENLKLIQCDGIDGIDMKHFRNVKKKEKIMSSKSFNKSFFYLNLSFDRGVEFVHHLFTCENNRKSI